MINEYILKHDDTDVIVFNVNTDYYNVNQLEILDNVFNPINETVDKITQIALFNGWLADRCIPNSREGAERLKNKYNIKDIKQLMILMHGLSLSDHYWIDTKPNNNKWKDINLYENRYDNIVGNILFDKNFKLVKNIQSYGDRNPDITTIGNLKKYWYYNESDTTNYLVKGGSKFDFQEPFNEYYAHLLLKELNFRHTPYALEKIDNEFFSVCPCMSDMDNEMVSAIDIIRRYGITKDYNGFVSIGQKQGCVGFEHEVNKMIILDYFIDNIDRHWYNFGIMRNVKTGSWKSIIPIYDNGYSLWNKDYIDSKIISESMSFSDNNEDCMKFVNIGNYINKLPDIVQIFDQAFDKYENKARKEELRKGIKEKKVLIEKFIENK